MTRHPQVGRALIRALAVQLLLIGAGLGLWLVLAPVRPADLHLVRLTAHLRDPGDVALSHAIAAGARSGPLLVLSGLLALLLRGRSRHPWSIGAATLQALVMQNVVKVLIERPRPPVVRLEHDSSSSYPSGHSAESAAFLTALAFALWPLLPGRAARVAVTGALAALGGLVAFSRVLLGVHYPTDVGGGLLLGILAGALCGHPRSLASTRARRRSRAVRAPTAGGVD